MTSFIKEFWLFLKARKKLWLLPMFIIMFLISGILLLTQGTVIAPFIYTLF